MNYTLKRLFVLALCINLAACTTLHGVPDWQSPAKTSPSTSLRHLKPGDRITVSTAGNQRTELVFVSLTTDALEGAAGKNKQAVRIQRDQILRVERREFSLGKTAGLVAATLLAVILAALGSAFGDPLGGLSGLPVSGT